MEKFIKKSKSREHVTEIACPTCRESVIWDKRSLHRPFCSTRCKQIDFGEWATEGFKIPAKEDNIKPDNSEKDEDIQY